LLTISLSVDNPIAASQAPFGGFLVRMNRKTTKFRVYPGVFRGFSPMAAAIAIAKIVGTMFPVKRTAQQLGFHHF
jgi:hypothetical protein